MNIRADVGVLNNIVYKHRNSLNKIGELGMKEYKTSKYIKDYLDILGIEYEIYLETAVVGIIKGKKAKKNIAFRADMDALNIDGQIKHLCGHDGHMSILLGFIEYLNINKDKLLDNIIFIFQPAEESPGGALPLIKEGVLDKYKVDEIYGLHIYPEIDEGFIGVKPSHFLAQTGEIDIEIVGRGGHGAMPQNAIDSIMIASNFINTIQSIVSRNIRPLDEGVLSIGKIEGGSRRNIIAESVKLEGTIRAFKQEVYDKIKQRVFDIACGFEKSFDCSININIKDDYPAVNNDEELFYELKEAIDDKYIKILEPLMISEDFSYYQQQVKGLFFMLGARNIDKEFISGLHHIKFNFDEKILLNGINTYVELLKYKGALSE
ncbi:amidohydrolase [Tepidibacter aestuarii]|uniref:amidohydrolase n=1 Tax=Tepidibacter aestuarii TaxID=2925782 RepID=UPI0020BF75FD|nr:amidohydrolase [Tepidibacter aestuarii]CAH2214430.1 N-acetyldiaminopimelate deacetylase [Tepidibacter aestuarii]